MISQLTVATLQGVLHFHQPGAFANTESINSMKTYTIAVLGLTFVVLEALVGCATPARVASMIPSAETASVASPGSFLYRSIAVSDVGGGEATNPMWTSEVGNEEFREALVEALERQSFLSVEKIAPFQLTAFIIEMKHPQAGFSITVNAFVRYKLIRSSDSEAIFDDMLHSTFTATVDEAFLGMERLRLAEEGAIRANISLLLTRLRNIVAPL